MLANVNPPTPDAILTFDNPPTDAKHKLLALANGYANQRDDLMRQQLLFDVSMMGLGVAAIVNPCSRVRRMYSGLALGAAAAGGGRTYFGPQAKVTAYNAAWLSLTCASLVADSIAAEKAGDSATGPKLVSDLASNITAAEPSLSGNAVLLAAYNQAQKSLAALQTALEMLNAASIQLAQYGLTVITTATNRVLAKNVQNVSAVTAAVTAAAKPAQAPAPPHALAAARAPDAATLTLELQNNSAMADTMTQRINTVMGALPKCTPSS